MAKKLSVLTGLPVENYSFMRIFYPASQVWLDAVRTLKSYGFEDQDVIEFAERKTDDDLSEQLSLKVYMEREGATNSLQITVT